MIRRQIIPLDGIKLILLLLLFIITKCQLHSVMFLSIKQKERSYLARTQTAMQVHTAITGRGSFVHKVEGHDAVADITVERSPKCKFK